MEVLDISGSFAGKTKNSNSMLSHELEELNKGISNSNTSNALSCYVNLAGTYLRTNSIQAKVKKVVAIY